MGQKSQWDKIFEDHITEDRLECLEDFKSTEVNHKISLWNPSTNGLRYLKMLIYNLFDSLTDNQKSIIVNCKNRDFGNPVSVKREGHTICLDYIQASLEVDVISKNISLDKKSLLEIGAGYGRTCHAIISNFNISSYTICDIGGCLELSKKYLQEVLKEEDYKKISFVSPEDLVKSKDKFNLCINIDSFAEMDRDIVIRYLKFIDENCENFYTKNPVGKYVDSEISGDKDPESISLALKSGILKDIVEIHSDASVIENSKKFIKAYKPSDKWMALADSWPPPISYYWQAFYKRSGVKND